jgi:hypothetical protein
VKKGSHLIADLWSVFGIPACYADLYRRSEAETEALAKAGLLREGDANGRKSATMRSISIIRRISLKLRGVLIGGVLPPGRFAENPSMLCKESKDEKDSNDCMRDGSVGFCSPGIGSRQHIH